MLLHIRSCPMVYIYRKHITWMLNVLYICSVLKRNNKNNFSLCRLILEKEGPRSLFRGLGPNLVGVAPSRYVQYYLQYSVCGASICL